MENKIISKEERFFIENFDTANIFAAIDRIDFVYLFTIKKMQKENKVYLSDLAQAMNQPMAMISRSMERIQDKGYIIWKVDDEVGKTYVKLTVKAIEMLEDQRKTLDTIYARIKEKFSEEELEKVSAIMKEIRDIARELNEK